MGRYATMTHASESQHWYTRKGDPLYEVKRADGKGTRPTTLADARKLGLVPSVTSIIKCAAAPGLERWKADQLMMAALTLPRRPDEPEKEWLARVVLDSKEHAKKAADRGTAIHAAIQGHLQNETPDPAYLPHIQGAIAAVDKLFAPDWDCVLAEQPFAHPLGFGGKLDLMGTSPWFVADFKTKEFGPEDELKTWDEHAMQLGAYREGQQMPVGHGERVRGAIVYVSTTHPGLARAIELPEEALAKGWTMFYSLLHYWQAKNVYRSAFTPQEAVAA